MNRFLHILLAAVILLAGASASEAYAQKKGKAKAKTTQTAGKKSTKSKGKKSTSSKSGKDKKSSGKSSGKKGSNKKETSADVRRRQQATQKEIQLTEQQIRENDAKVKKNLTELGKLQTDIDAGKKRVADAAGKVDALETQIEKLQTQIAADEKNLEKMRSEYLKAVKQMRVKKKSHSSLAFIFSSKSFNEAARRMRYLKQFSDWRDEKSGEITARVTSLKKQSEQLSQTKSMHDKALSDQLKAQSALQKQYTAQDAIVVELKKNGKALKSHLAKKQAEANSLNGRIAALIAQEQAKAEAEAREREARAQEAREQEAREREARERELIAQNAEQQPKQEASPEKKSKPGKPKKSKEEEQGVTYAEARRRKPRGNKPSASENKATSTTPKKATTVAAPAGGNFASMKGSLPHPVAGAFKVTSRFGRHSLPDLPDVVYDNPGIDAEVSPGSTAQAVYGGKVSGVYMIPGYNTVVIVNHGGYYTVYGNISSASVKVGDVVKQGQSLGGLAPDEDNPSASMIHFEVWKNREKLDPQGWLR